jgi:hypothetical protein
MAAGSHKPITTFLFENLSHKKGIVHFISTRNGGTSNSPFDTLNISFNVSDDPEVVLKNRKLLAEAVGFDAAGIVTAKQVHDNKVALVTKDMRGKGAFDFISALDGIDAMVTNVPKICLMVQVADCVPVLLYDPVKKVIGAVHAGYKGTILKIAENAVKSMIKQYRSDPNDIYVGIGPSIGPCCYEVGKEVVKEVKDSLKNGKDLINVRKGKSFFDLWKANRSQVEACGVPRQNIEVAGICTNDRTDMFFSFRAGKGTTGRFAAGIMLA